MKSKKSNKRTLCLYGIDRNGIPVLMFFNRKRDLRKFMETLPGSYDTLTLRGIGYDDFTIGALDIAGTECEKRAAGITRLYSDRESVRLYSDRA